MYTDKFEGTFTVLKKFMLSTRVAMPGETVRLTDAFLARDLVQLGRVSADEMTIARMKSATAITVLTSSIDARALPDGNWILPTKIAGVVRRLTLRG